MGRARAARPGQQDSVRVREWKLKFPFETREMGVGPGNEGKRRKFRIGSQGREGGRENQVGQVAFDHRHCSERKSAGW